MGNQPTSTICCADTTGSQRGDLSSTSSYENGPNSARGKPRLLRRVIDTFRPSPRGQQTSSFFKGKFASSTMEMDPLVADQSHGTSSSKSPNNSQHARPEMHQSLLSSSNQDSSSSRQPPPHNQVRSLSSMSTQSEVGGERFREARSDKLSRRSSYCSAREGVEEERERIEPEGNRFREATE